MLKREKIIDADGQWPDALVTLVQKLYAMIDQQYAQIDRQQKQITQFAQLQAIELRTVFC